MGGRNLWGRQSETGRAATRVWPRVSLKGDSWRANLTGKTMEASEVQGKANTANTWPGNTNRRTAAGTRMRRIIPTVIRAIIKGANPAATGVVKRRLRYSCSRNETGRDARVMQLIADGIG